MYNGATDNAAIISENMAMMQKVRDEQARLESLRLTRSQIEPYDAESHIKNAEAVYKWITGIKNENQ
jgi:hypothetical protein